ncbi:hypothetical protein DFH06DRAFT_729369 [Mycena polygramma]|nr:hypothetical protein DFH06DRAFT_729369 [Mycena polygramma]
MRRVTPRASDLTRLVPNHHPILRVLPMRPPSITSSVSPGLLNVENRVKALRQEAGANIEHLIVPIGKLPTELLLEIFKLAVHTPVLGDHIPWEPLFSHRNLYHGNLRTGLRKVLRLSQVSSYWRQTVHEAPELWAECVVGVHLGGKQGVLPRDAYLDGLKTLLSRSSPYPISFSFKMARRASTDDCIVGLIAPTLKRWKNLHLALDSFDRLDGLPSHSGAFEFEALERVHIRGLSRQTNAFTAFQSSPRLRSFALETDDELPKIHLIQLPWRQLTHLDVWDYSLGGCRNALLQCASLVSARFVTCSDWDLTVEAADTPVVVLPFLTTLNMTVEGSDSGPVAALKAFLAPLALPALTTLDLTFDPEDDEYWPIETFSAFQDRAPELEKILLMNGSLGPDALVALLRHAPALETLDIQLSWDCVDDGFLEALRYDEADPAPPLAPRLTDIKLYCVGEVDEGLLEGAIRSRWWADDGRVLADGSPPGVSRLRRVAFTSDEYDAKDDAFKTRTEDLVRQGLDLYVVL